MESNDNDQKLRNKQLSETYFFMVLEDLGMLFKQLSVRL